MAAAAKMAKSWRHRRNKQLAAAWRNGNEAKSGNGGVKLNLGIGVIIGKRQRKQHMAMQ